MKSKELLSLLLAATGTCLLFSGFIIVAAMGWMLSGVSFINVPVFKVTLSGLRTLALVNLWGGTLLATLGMVGIARTGEDRLWKGIYLLFPSFALWGTILAVFFV